MKIQKRSETEFDKACKVILIIILIAIALYWMYVWSNFMNVATASLQSLAGK